ncbi:MAG: PAS domain-containing protein [Gemmatimonadaceae bacterium]|nr:PAS domain-containing protein [Gemmatimonadaceae bacterium]
MGTTSPRAPRDSISMRALECCPDSILLMMGMVEPIGPTIIFVNKAFERLTGYRRSEAWGQTPRALLNPGFDASSPDPMLAALRAGEDFHGELSHVRRDGSTYVADWKVSPMRDASGEITHWIAVQREVQAARGCADSTATSAEWAASGRSGSETPAMRASALAIATLRVEQVTVEPEQHALAGAGALA